MALRGMPPLSLSLPMSMMRPAPLHRDTSHNNHSNHNSQQHQSNDSNKRRRVGSGTAYTPQEIEQWIADRRRNFPRRLAPDASDTNANVTSTKATSCTEPVQAPVLDTSDDDDHEHEDTDEEMELGRLLRQQRRLAAEARPQGTAPHHLQVADTSEALVADVSEALVADVSEALVADASKALVADASKALVAICRDVRHLDDAAPEEVTQQTARQLEVALANQHAAPARPRKPCEFFTKNGSCKWGTKCRYLHQAPPIPKVRCWRARCGERCKPLTVWISLITTAVY
jgi:hypothetical protein